MSKIVVQEFISLDGVIQGPGGRDEDSEGGFALGRWTGDYDDRMDPAGELTSVVVEWESRTETLLLGRKTYDIWAGAWGVWDEGAEGITGEFTRRYNRVPKYVASRTLTSLGWKNSHLIGPDLPAEVDALRAGANGEVRVWGSADLVRTLADHDLVDEYRLMVYPIILGAGKRLFPAGFRSTTLRPVESRVLASGVQVATYQRAE